MIKYFPILYKRFYRDTNVKFDLSNYVTKTDLKKCITC